MNEENYAIGIGCKRNSSYENIANAVEDALKNCNLKIVDVKVISSCDLKSDEEQLLKFASNMEIPLKFFTKEQLQKVQTPNPSNMVMKKIGIPAVCEAAALLAAEFFKDKHNNDSLKLNLKNLIFQKKIYNGVTIAIAKMS